MVETNDISLFIKKENLGFSCKDLQEKLEVDIWCLAEGTNIPLVKTGTVDKLLDEKGNQLFYEATSDLLKNSVLTSKSDIIFDCNHDLNTNIGNVDKLYLDDEDKPTKLGAKGIVDNPLWIKNIIEDKYSGISIYGKFTQLDGQDSLEISRISFLSKKPGACDKSKCHVKEVSVAAVEGWDGNKAKQSLFDFFSDDDGNLQKQKLKKYFLIVEEPGENKGDYKYPIGEVIDGAAQITKEGCWTAFNFASREDEQKRHPELINKLIRIMKREGIELPPSVKADDQSNKILKGENMTLELNDEVKAFLKETITETVKTSLGDVQTSVMDSMSEQFEQLKAGFAAAASDGPEGPEPVIVEPPDFWELAKETIGLDEIEFTELKESASKVPDMTTRLTDYETKLSALNQELSSAKEFITEVEKRELIDKLPPALRDGTEVIKEVIDGKEVETEVQKIDLLYKEMKENPGKFWNKHLDAVAQYKVQREQPGFAAGSSESSMTPDKLKRNDELRRLRPHGR